MMKKITVFCASSLGNDNVFTEQAYQLGKELAANNLELVYGGAKVGLMGIVANGVLENGGRAIGVLPRFLQKKELAHKGLTELILVDTMHERKAKMNELCDGVIAMPGGFGTLEELFEMLTWGQLALHTKPVALLNVNGFYDGLLSFIEDMVGSGLLKEVNRKMLLSSSSITDLLELMRAYQAPTEGKWIAHNL